MMKTSIKKATDRILEFLLFLPPFLLVLVPLFAVAAENNVHIDLAELVRLTLGLVAGFFMIFGIMLLVAKDRAAALKGLTYFALLWVAIALLSEIGPKILPGRYNAWTVLGLFMAFSGLLLANRQRLPFGRDVQYALLVFSVMLLGFQMPGVAKISGGTPIVFDDVALALAARAPVTEPHVVYIVPDRYASNRVLRALYGFDNSTFTEALRERGFYVWEDHNSNYPKTFQSLASSLNMNYLGPVADYTGPLETSYIPVHRLVRDNQVTRIMRDHGYKYVHLGNWWEPTRVNDMADHTVTYGSPFSEFSVQYFRVTPLVVLNEIFNTGGSIEAICALTDQQAETIAEMVRMTEKPLFFFWHLFSVHPPYMYDAQGNCRAEKLFSVQMNESIEKNEYFLDQIRQTNRMLLDLFDRVQAQSGRPLVFIIQSDEGPWPEEYEIQGKDYDFSIAEDREVQRKMGIINAIYLPSQNYRDFSAQRTPVNNFRLVFREIFKTDIPLLEQKSYLFNRQRYPYELKEVSGRLRPRQND